MAGADLARSHEFVERQRYRSSGCVAVVIDRNDELLARQAELARGRLQYPYVRLVRDEPIAVLARHLGGEERLARGFVQHAPRELEHRLAVHLEERRADDGAAADV